MAHVPTGLEHTTSYQTVQIAGLPLLMFLLNRNIKLAHRPDASITLQSS